MNFYEWRDSGSDSAERFKERIRSGEKGNPDNPQLAAILAFDEGVREGKRRASEALINLINSNTK